MPEPLILGSFFDSFFDVFLVSLLDVIFPPFFPTWCQKVQFWDPRWRPARPRMAPKIVQVTPKSHQKAYPALTFLATFFGHRFWNAFWVPFGSLFAPFWSLVAPFRHLWAPFRALLDPFWLTFWSLWLFFGSYCDPLAPFWWLFGSCCFFSKFLFCFLFISRDCAWILMIFFLKLYCSDLRRGPCFWTPFIYCSDLRRGLRLSSWHLLLGFMISAAFSLIPFSVENLRHTDGTSDTEAFSLQRHLSHLGPERNPRCASLDKHRKTNLKETATNNKLSPARP